MWAQTWGALYEIAAPFPDAGDRPDATPEIEKVTYHMLHMQPNQHKTLTLRASCNIPLSSQKEKCSTMQMSFSNRLV